MTLTIEQRQYQTYILTDDTTQNLIEVLPERGGIITRWQVGGRELFYLDTERMLDPSLSIRGGNPILFPICGNLVDNSYNMVLRGNYLGKWRPIPNCPTVLPCT
jgi:galactose mutarotase-like enzyme